MFGPKAVVGLVFALLGCVFFAAGVVKTVEANQIAMHGVSTTGVVTGVYRRSTGRGRGSWTPSIEFRTTDGQARSFRGSPGSMVQSTYQEGDVLPVAYMPGDPSQAVIDTLWGRFGFLSKSLFASLFIGLGGFLIRWDRKEAVEDGWERRRF